MVRDGGPIAGRGLPVQETAGADIVRAEDREVGKVTGATYLNLAAAVSFCFRYF